MENNQNQVIFNSDAEYQQYQEFLAERQAKEEKERAKNERDTYRQLVDETIDGMFPTLLQVSQDLCTKKTSVIDAFKGALKLKASIFKVKDEQKSHTFTNSDNTRRIILGHYVTDAYRDTVEDGIAIIKEVILSKGTDATKKALVNAIMKLLSRDAAGNLKASRVLQLRKLADELDDDRFREGVQIIEEAYQPAVSKQFVRAEYKNDNGAWMNVPLGMTEA